MAQSQKDKDELVARMRTGLSNHTPSEEGIKSIGKIRSAAKLLGEVIVDNTDGGRDQSLALTHLEDAVMRAVRQVAFDTGTPTDGKP